MTQDMHLKLFYSYIGQNSNPLQCVLNLYCEDSNIIGKCLVLFRLL